MTFKNFKTLIDPLFFRFKDVQSLWAQADFASASGKHWEAKSIYRHLSKNRTDTPQTYMYAGLSEFRLNNAERAAYILETGLKTYPGDAHLLEHFLRICSELGQIERVIPFLDQPSRCSDTTTLWRLADLLLQNKRKDKAEAIYKNLAKRKPIHPENFLHCALAEERLQNLDNAADILEAGLLEYPIVGYLLEHYLRICTGAGQIDRVIRIVAPEAKNKKQACQMLFDRLLDSQVQLNLIDYCLRNDLVELADERLNIIRETSQDVLTQWRVAELLSQSSRKEAATAIYKQLTQRSLESPDDYYFAGLSFLRLENIDDCLAALERGQAKHLEAGNLSTLYVQLCASRFEFERYARFVKETNAISINLSNLMLNFYRDVIKSGAPEAFIFNFKEIELRCESNILQSLKDEFISFLRENPQPSLKAKLIIFFCKYIDIDSEFSSIVLETLKGACETEDHKRDGQALQVLHDLTPLMIPHCPIEPDEVVLKFIQSCQSLSRSSMELEGPIRDMTNNWAPWQNIFCLVSPKLYGEAMAAFEHLAFKIWPKLNFTAPHVQKTEKLPTGARNRIRIGFNVHDSMPMMSGLLNRLDKNIFETVYLRPGKAGLSDTAKNWIVRAEKTVEYSDIDTYSAVETIASQELDIIVSGPSMSALFFPMMARLAKLQMVLLEPNWTDGLTNSDYYISWQPAEPSSPSDFYRTAVSFLQHPPYWIEKPLEASRPISPELRIETRQRLLKVGSESRVYLCANTPPKISPEMDGIFCDLLEHDSAATIVLLRAEYPSARNLRIRLQEKLGKNYERVIFLSTLGKDDAHLLLQSVDCCLDSYPLCGMSSSFDGAMLGVPTVTLPAGIPFGQWTASIYEYIGVSGLTAKNRKEYIDIAMKVAGDVDWRYQKAVEIKEKSSRFVENQSSSDEFQEFIIHAWKRTLAGLPPANWISGGWQ
jgi:predicted O-linked N-acetylglucosamine transferase (SPINDLY family)/tetratricopeptide (TPR) repeat protein